MNRTTAQKLRLLLSSPILLLLLIGFNPVKVLAQPPPDCVVFVNITSTGGSPATQTQPTSSPWFDNRTIGCQFWVFQYQTNRTSGSFTSISFQSATGASTPGTFSDWSGSTLTGINPAVNQVGNTATFSTGCVAGNPCATPNSWERILLTRNTWVGTINGVLYGYKQNPGVGGGGGGGSGSVLQVVIQGTSAQITATGTCTITITGTCTLSLPSNVVLPGTINSLTLTTSTGTFTLTNAKVFTVNNTLTIQATDNSTVVFPDPSGVTSGHCVQVNKTGSVLTFADAGAACGSGSGGTGNAGSVVTTTFSATPTFTCPSASAGTVTNFKLSTVLSANITASTLASCTSGQILNFNFGQAASGTVFTVAMPTGFSQACQVSSIYNSTTKMSFWWDGSNAQLINCSVDIGPNIDAEQAAPSQTPTSGYEYGWLDSSGLFPRWKNSAGTVFQGAKELTANQFRVAGGVNTADSGLTPGTGVATALANAADGTGGFCLVGGTGCPGGGGGAGFSGTVSLGTSAISSGACATVVTSAQTGMASTNTLNWTFNADPTAVTGYSPSTSGMLTIIAYPTTNTANFKVCNNTGSSITPGAITLNFSASQGAIASGTSALDTGAITSGTCATVVTTAATGALTTSTIAGSFNGDPTAVTGYSPTTGGMLTIIGYPTSGNVNWKVCNNTTGSITPGAITLNWRIF